MISKQIEHLFTGNGYDKVPSNLPEFTFYYRKEYQAVTVIHVIDYRPGLYISLDQYAHLKEKITQFMHDKGNEEIHLLSLVLSDDTEKARQLCADDCFCWVIDTRINRLLIYESQVSDFYGWKGILEAFLLQPEQAGREGMSYNTGGAAYDADRGSDDMAYGNDVGTERVRDWSLVKNLPWVNICLVAVNVIVFLICTFTGRMLYNKGASGVAFLIEDKSYYRLITSMFLHTDVSHLFNNMIILYFVGELVERNLGHLRYAVLYLLSGIAGDVLSMGYELLWNDYYSSVGASGAVFGVQGALLLLVILHRGRLESLSAGRVAFMIAFSLYCGFTSSNVNNAAHIGGVLMGFALAAVFSFIGKRAS